MAGPFIGEIRMVGFNFAPPGWAFCNGQLMPLSQNTALFSLLGTTYGGDGRTTFALPDFRSRGPIHFGQGPGLSLRELGEMGGEEASALPGGSVEIPQSPANPTVLSYAPAGRPVNIMEPFLVVNFIICLNGSFPSHSMNESAPDIADD
ncbi:MAG TPA: phage tail protein [Blastocatellia bacterium]|nr:phage tail protein [Blastocatellia bacterium]